MPKQPVMKACLGIYSFVRVFVRIKGYKHPSKKHPIGLKVNKYSFFCFSIKMQNLSRNELRLIPKNRNINPKDILLRIINNNIDNNNNNNNNNNKIIIIIIIITIIRETERVFFN